MNETIKLVQAHYDSNVELEWDRIAGRPEFLLTCRMMERYIKAGDRVLDIGGGPGRYSLHLSEKGCDVTLVDLSPGNIDFAKEKAKEQKLPIKALPGNALDVERLIEGRFDHVLLMGPLYHLLAEEDRITAINAAINLLKPGGILYVSFINMFAGVIFEMKFAPEMMASTLPMELDFRENIFAKGSYAGDGFTKVFFIEQSQVLPFMSQFPLEKMHLFGQEGITSPCEDNIMSQTKEVVDAWLDFCEKIWEREELLSWSEHLMYIGRKI